MENKTNSIVHALYLEYTGRKTNLLDSAVLAKAGVERLTENERVYALINISRLYAFRGFYPIFEDVLGKSILYRNDEKVEMRIDLEKFVTELDKVEEILKAISLFPKFSEVTDKRLAIFNELHDYYGIGKDFGSMLASYLNPKDCDRENIEKVLSKIKSFIRKYDKTDNDAEIFDNILDVVFSEVKEDLEEILR